MRTLLIMPPECSSSSIYCVPPYGLLILAAVLRNKGHEVQIEDYFSFGYRNAMLRNKIEAFQPDIVGISGMVFHHNAMLNIAHETKKIRQNTKVVLGGVHASTWYERLTKEECVDAVFIGEAEESFPLYIESLEQGKNHPTIPGISYSNSESLYIGERTYIKDLNSLPFPAWDLCNPQKYQGTPHGFFYSKRPIATLVTSRGCPNVCSFCAGHIVSGRKWRAMQPERVAEEMSYLKKDFGVQEVHIQDDNFSLDYDRVMTICQLITEKQLNLAISCPNGLHINTLDEAMLRAMKKAGFYNIAIGIESGSTNIQKKINKKLDLDMVREKISLIRRAGIYITGFFMIGMPYETEEEVLKTIHYATSLPINGATCSMFMPLPGTFEFENLIKSGKLNPVMFDTDARGWLEGNPSEYYDFLTTERLKKLQRLFAIRFWCRPRILLKTLYRILYDMKIVDILRAIKYFFKYTTQIYQKR